jgi:D-methionine transport system substrate-binding protein
MSFTRKFLYILAVLPIVGLFSACVNGNADEVVRIGVVGASDPYWAAYEEAAEEAGITVEIVDFSDYTQPNPAVSAGEIDLNQFQHIVYLADYNVSSGASLVPIGSTAIYPLGLYSTQYDSVASIPNDATVAVPNDASNLARGLLVLQSVGLIELKDGGTVFSTLNDVDTATSRVKVTALEASLTPTSLPDVAAAIINNDFVGDAGLSFQDAIAQDSPSDPKTLPYVNIFAARASETHNETYKKLVEIYQNSQSVLDGVQKVSEGTAVFVKIPAVELEASLRGAEEDTRKHG